MVDITECRKQDIKGLIERNVNFSKGDAGRVLIIGGAERYVGAAVLAGLAALRCGVDSVTIAAPETCARLMNAFSADLVTVKLPGEDLSDEHIGELSWLSENASVVLVGPGLGVSPEREALLAKLLPQMKAPMVLDADATKQVQLAGLEKTILFANKQEYEHLKETNGFTDEHVAPSLGTNVVVVKGRQDLILCSEGHSTVTGGHSRATVAGTGDVLAGIAAALYAQSKDIRGATLAACTVAKRAAVKLGEKHHFGFLASEFTSVLPDVLKELKVFRVTKHQTFKGSLTDRFRKA
ncbi:NAD(P)H-hydrate dehydratase [Candidatus Woesearchaeota archaeon]|nr:NAD(P)H-hydrate dehydratase [Candidatus Woesearchaeota archaeon]